MTEIYNINPIPKPRMTRSDKWKQRDCVMNYRAFCDQVRAAGLIVPESGTSIVFYLPMPDSWSKKKKAAMYHTPHQVKPDVDNLLKSLLDACYKNDSHVWNFKELTKLWDYTGQIEINEEGK